MTLSAVIDRSRRAREEWRYTDLPTLLARPPLAAATKTAAKSSSAAEPRLVFVDGIYRPERCAFGPLPQDVVQQDGAGVWRLTLADQTCLVAAPIELLFLREGDAPEVATKLFIEIGASASATLIERHEGGASAAVADISIRLAPQAKLVHDRLLLGRHQGAHLARTDVTVAEGAYYRHFSLIQGVRLARNEIRVDLQARLAQASLGGVALLTGDDHADTLARVTHSAPHGTSRQSFRTVLDGRARGVFQGKIVVAEGAQKTDGKQISRALLLSPMAEMDAKPELEIYADDVACSHGCTVGNLDDDALFYLRTRGLDEDKARVLLLRAFVADVIEDLPSAAERDAVNIAVQEWFDER